MEPYGELTQASDGNLYGTTYLGGTNDSGTIFKITLSGTLTTLYSFCPQPGCNDGDEPFGGLVQATNGKFYGTTWGGGSYDFGTVFSLDAGLSPFAQVQPTSSKEGDQIWILGQGFRSSSVVKFGGTQATTTTPTSSTFILATVPTDALTGLVTVTTGTTKLTGSKMFRVIPTILKIPNGGSIGTPVPIEGTGLAQTTKVTFGGVATSAFTVNSDTLVACRAESVTAVPNQKRV